MLEAVEIKSRQTIQLINDIKKLMQQYKHNIRSAFPKIYSQDLINNLFRHPYTKIEFIRTDLACSRITATNYLDTLSESGFLQKEKIGRNNYYINVPLFHLLQSGRLPELNAPTIITSTSKSQ